MDKIFTELAGITLSGRRAVFCVVVDTSGSTPRKAGSKMIVFEDKSIIGTVGGGNVEFQVIEEAMKLIGKSNPVKKSYKLFEDLKMQCGGSVEIYLEPINPTCDLVIFGAGHIGKALCRYAADFGFSPVVVDNRKEELDNYCFQKCRLINEDYLKSVDLVNFTSNTFVVIVTPKHIHDEEILKAVCQKKHAYIGLIGSKRKVAVIRQNILAEKIISEKELDAVNMPIGVDIASETPEEIAISILAKLIDVKNNLNKSND